VRALAPPRRGGPDARCRKNYTFKCHRQDQRPGTRDQSLVYAVNGVGFHPRHPSTFFTVGADGAAVFWDRDARTRLACASPALFHGARALTFY
jgi:hypothetical protein